jgi:hypothetical protein
LDADLTYWKPGFTERRIYGSLKRAWIGFIIAYRESNQEKLNYYAAEINKLQGRIGYELFRFADNLKAVQQGT